MAISSSASSRTGNAKATSRTRLIAVSTRPPAIPAGESQQDRDRHGQAGRAQADAERLPGSVDDPRVEVAAGVVRAEQMAEGRGQQGVLKVDRGGAAVGEQARGDGRHHDEQDDQRRDGRSEPDPDPDAAHVRERDRGEMALMTCAAAGR